MSRLIERFIVLLVIAGTCQWGFARHLRHHNNSADDLKALEVDGASPTKNRRSLQQPEFYGHNRSMGHNIPYSYNKLDKMMQKAILKIILGDLRPSDMELLKAFNYSVQDVIAIRKHELNRLREEKEFEIRAKKEQEQQLLNVKYQAMRRRSFTNQHKKTLVNEELEAFNRKAVYDYENGLTATISSNSDYNDEAGDNEDEKPATEESFRQAFDKVMEPHVVFKIRYDDSEFDSGSDEKAKGIFTKHHGQTVLKLKGASKSSTSSSFQVSGDADSEHASERALLEKNLEELNRQTVLEYENLVTEDLDHEEKPREPDFSYGEEYVRDISDAQQSNESATMETSGIKEENEAKKQESPYEGLEWVGGDVYRVKPEAMAELLKYEEEAIAAAAESDEQDDGTFRTSDTVEDIANDTVEYQNDATSGVDTTDDGNFTENQNQNLTMYQRLARAQRRDQKMYAMEDIKQRVLALTGRFNNPTSNNNNQVVKEKLRMFYPTCQMPRNTEAEAWSDLFSMNMHFQLNLTANEHVVAAKLRLFMLPQDIATSHTISTNEEEEEDEKKIRISVYFYTKSLKKHRVKKRLMDSVVMPLTSTGSHLAMDVRQGLRFWRPIPEHQQQQHGSGHSNNGNHGLVVQVEDQDGKPLKPALYIQEASCSATNGTDEKAYKFGPALFIRTCARYVRFVEDKLEIYVECTPAPSSH